MTRRRKIAALAAVLLFNAALVSAYLIQNYWGDGSDIVMDDVLLPAATWSDPAQFQMSEWNEVDTTNNSHPFRINLNPQFSFGANDGDNTIGFLDEQGLSSEYGLSFQNALAWTVCWTPWFSSRYDECDVIMDGGRTWHLSPHDSTWFQSTILHELGHVRGLGHYNNFLSMQNSGTSKLLRNEILYMDDKEGVRQHASHVTERDAVMYAKWHDGSLPRWMTMFPTTLREGDPIFLQNITIENRGTQSLSPLRFGIYLSTNSFISTADQRINGGSFSSFNRFTYSTFDWSAIIPTVNDCGTYWIGGIADDNQTWAERYEGNNAVTFSNGNPYVGSTFSPTALAISLGDDVHEPNDFTGSAAFISLPYDRDGLGIETDGENDYFRFDLGSSDILRVRADFTHFRGNIDAQLLSSTGSVVASSTSTNDDEVIELTAGPGTYYLRVYGVGAGSCNHYDLRVTHGSCGDLSCQGSLGENAQTCAIDCAQYCGDGICEATKGENESTCAADCQSCGNGICEPFLGEDEFTCGIDCCGSSKLICPE